MWQLPTYRYTGYPITEWGILKAFFYPLCYKCLYVQKGFSGTNYWLKNLKIKHVEIRSVQVGPLVLQIPKCDHQFYIWLFFILWTFERTCRNVYKIWEVSACTKSEMEIKKIWIGRANVKKTFLIKVHRGSQSTMTLWKCQNQSVNCQIMWRKWRGGNGGPF